MRRDIIGLLLAVAAAPAWATGVPLYRTFKDWTVGCDNTRHCTAVGMRGNEADGLVAILQRDAGVHGAVRVTLTGPDLDGDSRLLLDGRETTLDPPQWRWTPPRDADDETDHGRWTTRDADTVQAFVQRLRNGHRLAVAAFESDRPAPGAIDLSLQGLGAALLLIDDVQGRVGTRGAWARAGQDADARVPAPPPMPVLARGRSAAPLAERDATRLAASVRKAQARVLDDMGCEVTDGQEAFALTDAEALVLVDCMDGAYQTGSVAFRVPRNAPARAAGLRFATLPGEPEQDTLWFAAYDPSTGVLQHHMKGRGLGDCGDDAQWQFDGNAFRLLAYQSLARCGGLGEDDWPVLWRARVASGVSR